MSKLLLINGTRHSLTFDTWGSPLIDGKTIDEFMAKCSPEDIEFLAKKGLDVAKNEPEHFEDILERHEL